MTQKFKVLVTRKWPKKVEEELQLNFEKLSEIGWFCIFKIRRPASIVNQKVFKDGPKISFIFLNFISSKWSIQNDLVSSIKQFHIFVGMELLFLSPSFSEITLVLFLVLMLFGSKKLPDLARGLETLDASTKYALDLGYNNIWVSREENPKLLEYFQNESYYIWDIKQEEIQYF